MVVLAEEGLGASRRSARSRRRAVQSGVALAVAGVGGRGHLGFPSLLGQAADSIGRHDGALISQHPAQRSPTCILPRRSSRCSCLTCFRLRDRDRGLISQPRPAPRVVQLDGARGARQAAAAGRKGVSMELSLPPCRPSRRAAARRTSVPMAAWPAKPPTMSSWPQRGDDQRHPVWVTPGAAGPGDGPRQRRRDPGVGA
jgi:hypothetical protein